MPPCLVEKNEGIAKVRKESFTAIVREAAYTYELESLRQTEDELIVAASEIIKKSNHETVNKLDDLEKQLDETHQILSDIE